MAELDFDFDPNEVEPSRPREPVPAGDYQAVIEKSAMKETKNKTGMLLELQLKIVSGPFEGRCVWDRLNVVNPSVEAQKIARAQLSSICRACGVMHAISDSEELHDRLMAIHVKIEKDQNGNPQNRVTGYTAPSGSSPAPPRVASNGDGESPAAERPSTPWKKTKRAAHSDAASQA